MFFALNIAGRNCEIRTVEYFNKLSSEFGLLFNVLMQRQRKGKNRSRARRPLSGQRRINMVRGDHPPEFVPTICAGHRFRFSAAAATFVAVSRTTLLNLVSVAATTTLQYRVMAAIKLKRIRIWGQPPALGSASTLAQVEWLGVNSPSVVHSDSSMGVEPCMVDTRPPPLSSCSWWSTGGGATDTLCNITCPAGAIVDVDVTIRFIDSEGATASEAGTGGASTVGVVYYNYLDGFASKKLAPVGVTLLP